MKFDRMLWHHPKKPNRTSDEMLCLWFSHQKLFTVCQRWHSIGIVVRITVSWSQFHFPCIYVHEIIFAFEVKLHSRTHRHPVTHRRNKYHFHQFLAVWALASVYSDVPHSFGNGNENIRNFVSPVIFNGAFQHSEMAAKRMSTCTDVSTTKASKHLWLRCSHLNVRSQKILQFLIGWWCSVRLDWLLHCAVLSRTAKHFTRKWTKWKKKKKEKKWRQQQINKYLYMLRVRWSKWRIIFGNLSTW